MSDNGAFFLGCTVIITSVIGVFIGFSMANWQHEYISDDTIAKFRMAENLTSNMTIKEKIELIKTVCEDYYQRDACYKRMYDLYIEPNIGR